jgi:hypothetical protein
LLEAVTSTIRVLKVLRVACRGGPAPRHRQRTACHSGLALTPAVHIGWLDAKASLLVDDAMLGPSPIQPIGGRLQAGHRA